MWIVDAHGYGKRFIVRADELLTAFVEAERACVLSFWRDSHSRITRRGQEEG